MNFKRAIHVFLSTIILVWTHTIMCSPIPYDPSLASYVAIPQLSMPGPLMMAPQYDPYSAMQTMHPFFLASPYGPMAYEATRRSLPGIIKSERNADKHRASTNNESGDQEVQRALNDLPLSFIEPDGPSTITERLSDSFSAIGEGVKNHFRAISENFSETVDDLKDAWRPANKQQKELS